MASIKRIGKDKFGVPIWEAVYRRPGGKQVRRRFHCHNKADVEREIRLDSQRSGLDTKWSEGAKIYLGAKRKDGKGEGSLENVQRAVDRFVSLMGDLPIEETTSAAMKDFMRRVAYEETYSEALKKKTVSGPKVANDHRRKLLTIAKYLRDHTTMVSAIPFETVPPLPAKVNKREPIPQDSVNRYMEALPAHVMRPMLMLLLYGLRSSAVCNLTEDDVSDGFLHALDKGDVKRRIPIDEILERILAEAKNYKKALTREREERAKIKLGTKLLRPARNVFVNSKGQAWTRYGLRHESHKAWVNAGLEPKMPHEVRHTLGTMASRKFNPRMVQAAMGHRSEKSSRNYFHPDEEMALEVRKGIVTELSQTAGKEGKNCPCLSNLVYSKDGEYACPRCGSKWLIYKK